MSKVDLMKLLSLEPSKESIYKIAKGYVELYEDDAKPNKRRTKQGILVVGLDPLERAMEELSCAIELYLTGERFTTIANEIEHEARIDEAIEQGLLDPFGPPISEDPEVDE